MIFFNFVILETVYYRFNTRYCWLHSICVGADTTFSGKVYIYTQSNIMGHFWSKLYSDAMNWKVKMILEHKQSKFINSSY